jgi:hypothetical protein
MDPFFIMKIPGGSLLKYPEKIGKESGIIVRIPVELVRRL